MAKTLDEAGVKRLIQEIKGANKNLNTPIPISTENTPESMAQNVKNIADYVEKAKAAGVANVNGMAVTCLIDNDYSGVGYLYGEDMICGIKTYDDLATPYNFVVDYDGLYIDNPFIVKGTTDQITSDMLVEGARKPIILTPETTEVDEETYQKLSQEGTDVILNLEGGTIFIESQLKFNTGDTLNLVFGYSQFDESNDGVISTYTISINTSAPHTLTLAAIGSCEPVSKSTLSPVLQEIDLTGTDADRKAKLDQFETDWKALTGDTELNGAKFIGRYYADGERFGGPLEILFVKQYFDPYYYIGVGCATSETDTNAVAMSYQGILTPEGSLTITPLFSHLEAITIKTNNSTASKAANVAAINAYVDNLKALGVDTTKGYMIPCKFPNSVAGVLSAVSNSLIVAITTNGRGELNCYEVYIGGDNPGAVYSIGGFQLKISSQLTTTSKQIVGAINEVNALAKGYSTIFTPIELTTETAQNKTAIDARVAAFTAQGISLTNGCCIPVTYKGVYAGNISLINGDWYGLLVKNTNNPADNINIKLSADGIITEGNSVQ